MVGKPDRKETLPPGTSDRRLGGALFFETRQGHPYTIDL
jgi:hypothetical protein